MFEPTSTGLIYDGIGCVRVPFPDAGVRAPRRSPAPEPVAMSASMSDLRHRVWTSDGARRNSPTLGEPKGACPFVCRSGHQTRRSLFREFVVASTHMSKHSTYILATRFCKSGEVCDKGSYEKDIYQYP